MSQRPRALALCVLRHRGRLFVMEGHDSSKQQTFYRPLGGGIEFGERGADAAAREMREETGAELVNVRYLATLENLFTFQGRPGHEIILLYEAAFADARLYEREELTCQEDDGTPFRGLWMPLEAFREGRAILYPEGLLELLTRHPAAD